MEAMVKVVDEDMADGMQCSLHPFRTNPGGICAFCLQDKLGKLLSSSLPLLPPSSSSSPSSPPHPHPPPPASSSSSSSISRPSAKNEYYTRRTRLPFLLTNKKKKKHSATTTTTTPSSSSSSSSDRIIFKRSKSTATPRRSKAPFLDDPQQPDLVIQEGVEEEGFSTPCRSKRSGFWSFLHLSSKSSVSATTKSFRDTNTSPRISINLNNAKHKDKFPASSSSSSSLGKKTDISAEEDGHGTPSASASVSASVSSFERKVSRSRSVGCGSRSFSGDFFERISTGFGDCALRRVESQREGKPKVASSSSVTHRHSMKERVKCGGLFSGFMLHSSSSSSSSSSYLVSSSSNDDNGKSVAAAAGVCNGRAGSRNWGWAFASPIRAFTTKPSSKDIKNNASSAAAAATATATPNLSAIPSLLAVRG